MGIDEAFEEMSRLSSALFASPDAREGIAAFADKRPPRWHTEISP
jgi:enoyl-CoA hydratase/carnithine racemase